MSRPERTIAFGPAAALGILVLPLALVRRSRRLGLLAAALVAIELSPPYRAWATARAEAKLAALDDRERPAS